jgi:protein-S-isoprenylcysteine O-methyltransferase Ste14
MNEQSDSSKTAPETPPERPVAKFKVGRLSLTGRSAWAANLILLALIVALIIYSRPALGILLSGILWVVLIAYWSIPVKNAPAAKSTEPAKSRLLHERLLLLAISLLFIPVPGLTHRIVQPTLALVVTGLTIQVASMALYYWARQHLGRFWSGAVTITAEHQLIRTGPYRLLRHPMYTAVLGMFVGTVVVSWQIHALVALALGIAVYLRKIRIEERTIREAFGADYESYSRKTWGLIPGLF